MEHNGFLLEEVASTSQHSAFVAETKKASPAKPTGRR
jgi:indole-3-glycerol phosphate synthase